MPKRHQQRPARTMVGHNEPEKSTPITTGSYKKPETYREQALEHENPGKNVQPSKVEPFRDEKEGLTHKADSLRRMHDREKRSGSDSNAHKRRKGARLHEGEKAHQEPGSHKRASDEDFAHDLKVSQRPVAYMGLGEETPSGSGYSANDIKSLHTKLADLTNDELKSISLVPTGTRLEQGGKYIDLAHLEKGEFVALADMVAGPENSYVSKKETDYVLWNRLNQVTNPARLDEPGEME